MIGSVHQHDGWNTGESAFLRNHFAGTTSSRSDTPTRRDKVLSIQVRSAMNNVSRSGCSALADYRARLAFHAYQLRDRSCHREAGEGALRFMPEGSGPWTRRRP